MVEAAENLILEHLRAIRATLDRHTEEFTLRQSVFDLCRTTTGWRSYRHCQDTH